MAFEWDDAKRLTNLAKHGIDFFDAEPLFDGRPVVTLDSSTDDEERFLTIGIVDGRFPTVVWTERNQKIRMISAMRTREAEKRDYQSVHGGRA